jgi:hypothetical protein
MSNRGYGMVLTTMLSGIFLALLLVGCRPAASGAERESTPAPAGNSAGDSRPGRATVAEVLDGGVATGATVVVEGRCRGFGADLSDEAPPITRSDWLLEADGRRVYVSGAFPQGCSSVMPAGTPVTIRAEVAEDTLAAFGGHPPVRRRYLVRVPGSA